MHEAENSSENKRKTLIHWLRTRKLDKGITKKEKEKLIRLEGKKITS